MFGLGQRINKLLLWNFAATTDIFGTGSKNNGVTP